MRIELYEKIFEKIQFENLIIIHSAIQTITILMIVNHDK
jgi:hypothetical protein